VSDLIERVRATFLARNITGAETLLRQHLSTEPNDPEARVELARLLRYKGQFEESLAELDRADGPGRGWAAPLLRASLLSRLGRHDEAVSVQRYAIEHEGEHPRALLGLAHLLKTVGKIDEAADTSRRALTIDPGLGEAWWTLSSLRTVEFTEADRAAMAALLSDATLDQDSRMYVHFALARAFDAASDAAASWEHLSAANRIRAAQVRHDPSNITTLVDQTIARMTPDFFASREDWGDPSTAPIFVVGMPRSGSTLLEQMLASHSQIEGTIELPDVPALVRQVGGMGRQVGATYLQALAQLDEAAIRKLGEEYLRRSQIHRVLGRPFFVDKMPNNWLFAGFIRLILPHAKVIDVRRHPMDCGFSNYREFFARGQSYSSDLTHIARFYSDYVRLMRHFEEVQGAKIHRIIYERLVENPEEQLRSLFDYLGLPFEPQVLEFHKTERGVRTASAAQVRQPLNTKGIGQWRRYESWLAPLEAALGPVLKSWDK
jgi:tetratricopeptide (TPR) repeat protein